MTYRIGWVSPLTPKSGVGAFSKAVLDHFPTTVGGEEIDVTAFYVDHDTVFATHHRAVKIVRSPDFHAIFGVFDLLIYNVGNNREHHEPIYELLLTYPGVVICHDYVYQHYLADRCVRAGGHFASYAALLYTFAGAAGAPYIHRSQITSRLGRIRYSPWDTVLSVEQPMSEAILSLGSALVVHSTFSRRHAEAHFDGPILQLGLPHDQRPVTEAQERALADWQRVVLAKQVFDVVSFGHIQPSKCLDLVVEAVGSCTSLRERVRYTIAGFVGDPVYFDDLRAQVETLGLADIVTFELGVTDRRLDELMLKADVFINLRHPNTEAASLSLVEQLDTGRPVVVIDSGCYAEVPDDAALKLAPDITAPGLAAALHRLLETPASMVAMGRAGRRHAQAFTCRGYAEDLVGFALTYRPLLQRRAKAIFASSIPQPAPARIDRWMSNLCRARTALTYLDRGILQVDPSLVSTLSVEELSEFVGESILGLFGDMRPRRALARYFAKLDPARCYWACVTFALVADAVFAGDERAAARLMTAAPCLDPEFWGVLEILPARQFLMAAVLILGRRRPTLEELAQCERDDDDGYPTRSRVTALLTQGEAEAVAPLRHWAEQIQAPTVQGELPLLDDAELDVATATFRFSVDLSGFHQIETERVWTRGERGFIGVRLGLGVTTIEVEVSALRASVAQPCQIELAFRDRRVVAELQDRGDRWMRLDVETGAETAGQVVWLALSTNQAGMPEDSPDTRVLGVCLRKLRVKTRAVVDKSFETQRVSSVTQLTEAALRMRSAPILERQDAVPSVG